MKFTEKAAVTFLVLYLGASLTQFLTFQIGQEKNNGLNQPTEPRPKNDRSSRSGDTTTTDLSPTFKCIWLNGKSVDAPFYAIASPTRNEDKLVDIVSIGSKHQEDLHQTQISTWASHSSIRYFFGVTEDDDAYPDCDLRLTMDAMIHYSETCTSSRRKYRHSPIASSTMNHFAKNEYLKSKKPGWLCAQKRPLYAFGKLIRFYRKLLNDEENADSSLPDYMILVDDDSYYNMDLFQQFVKSWEEDSSFPRIEAGCLIKQPLHVGTNFSHPFGGFGLILSRGAIQNLMRPLHCNSNTAASSSIEETSSFLNHACQQLQLNWFGEASAFREGMSVSDLMDAHASREAYYGSDALSTSFPFCFHSDWILGHYMNHYHISSHVTEFKEPDPFYVKAYDYHRYMPTIRMGWSLGILYENKKKNPPRNCYNDGEKCPVGSQICHHLTTKQLKDIYDTEQRISKKR